MTQKHTLHPLALSLPEMGPAIKCIQICRPGETPINETRYIKDHDNLNDAMNTFAGICEIAKQRSEPIPYLLLSAPFA